MILDLIECIHMYSMIDERLALQHVFNFRKSYKLKTDLKLDFSRNVHVNKRFMEN